MKLANKAYIVTLLMLTFVFTATAQNKNLRPASDPRNTAPTVGTGGAVGGHGIGDGAGFDLAQHGIGGAAIDHDIAGLLFGNVNRPGAGIDGDGRGLGV